MIDTLYLYDTITVIDSIKYIAEGNPSVATASTNQIQLLSLFVNSIIGIAALFSIWKITVEMIKKRKNMMDYYDIAVEPDFNIDIKNQPTMDSFLDASSDDNYMKVVQCFTDSTFKFRKLDGILRETHLKEEYVKTLLYILEFNGFIRRVKPRYRFGKEKKELFTLVRKPPIEFFEGFKRNSE